MAIKIEGHRITLDDQPVDLRDYLKQRTAQAHDALDASVADATWDDLRGYAAFLQRQLAARAPVEEWMARYCPAALLPPATVPHLRADLAALGVTEPIPASREFALPADAAPIGASWALAGSHLGNRAMLKSLRDTGADWPTAFLGDEAMIAFWRKLRPQIEREVSRDQAEGAARAADAVFAQFAMAFGVDSSHRDAA